MTDILDLLGWRVTDKRLVGDEYELEVSYEQQPDACQKCGVIGRLYKHGQKPVTYRDSPIRGRPVRLLVNVQRFKCRDCGGTFQQPLDSMEPGRLMTVRCAEYIAEQCLRDTFTNIAAHLGVNETTVRSVAADYIQKLDGHYTLPEVEYLGIDELYLGGEMRARLLVEQDCTCFSCHGKFAPAELFVSEVAPVVRGEHKANNVLLCQACHTRFHIEAGLILHTDSTS